MGILARIGLQAHVQLTWSSSNVVCFSSGVLDVSFGFSSALGADVGSSDAGSAPDKTKAANSISGHSLNKLG